MNRNASLAHVGGALLVSAFHGMESNAVRDTRRDVLRRVDRSLAHAHRQAANVSTTATLLVGVGLVAYVVKDQRRSRIEARASRAAADGTDRRLLPPLVTTQLHRLAELVEDDLRLLRTHVSRAGRLAHPGGSPSIG